MHIPISAITICEPDREVLLKHWLDFYCNRADKIFVVIQKDCPDICHRDIADLCQKYSADVRFFNHPFESKKIISFVHEILKSEVTGGWHLYVDADEFIDPSLPLRELALACESEGQVYVQFRMIDRISKNGELPKIRSDISLFEQFPINADITEKVLHGDAFKSTFCKAGWTGHHYLNENNPGDRELRWHEVLPLFHFKWDYSVIDRLQRRIRLLKAGKRPWAVESERFLECYLREKKIPVDLVNLDP